MGQIIGLKNNPRQRYEDWLCLLLYKAGARELRKSPDTYHIAEEDEARYSRCLSRYIAA